MQGNETTGPKISTDDEEIFLSAKKVLNGKTMDSSSDDIERNRNLWTFNFIITMVIQLGTSTVFVTLMTFMALYTMYQFGVQDSAAGFAASAFILGSGLVRIFAGKYMDFIGRKRLILIALVLFVICSALYPVALSYPVLVCVRIIHGGSFGAISTVIASSVIALIPAGQRGEGMGYFLAASTIAMAVGPLLAVQLYKNFGAGPVFLFTGVVSVLALVAASVSRLPERIPGLDERAGRYRLHANDILDPQALPTSFVVLLCAFGYAGVVTYLNPFLLERGLDTAASLFFVVFAAGMLIVRMVSGRRQDRKGDNSVVIPSVMVFSLSLGLLGMATETWQIVVIGVLAGLGYGGLLPSLQVVALSRARSERIGVAVSTHYLMLDTGVALGPVLFGVLIPVAGYRGLYLALSGTALASVGLYWFVYGRRSVRRS